MYTKVTKDIFIFNNGLYGFEDYKQYTFKETTSIFKLMVSTAKPEISFIVVSPFEILRNYEIDIDDSELKQIGITSINDMYVMCIVSLFSNENRISINLKSPIILSLNTNKGKQVILDDSPYETRYYMDIVKKS